MILGSDLPLDLLMTTLGCINNSTITNPRIYVESSLPRLNLQSMPTPTFNLCKDKVQRVKLTHG